MNLWEQIITVDGEKYYDPVTFGKLTNHSEQSIRTLYITGNFIRKLKVVYKVDRPLIPVSELTEFPFTYIGRPKKDGKKETYHFTAHGEVKK